MNLIRTLCINPTYCNGNMQSYCVFYCGLLFTGGVLLLMARTDLKIKSVLKSTQTEVPVNVEILMKESHLHEIPKSGPYRFLVEEEDFCRRRPGLQIIGYVHSSISRIQMRNETRHTWANITAYNMGIRMGVIFVVGRAKDEREQRIVDQESQLYHDIVHVDVYDDYHLLTYKGLAALSWINNHCSNVPWTLHADDDMLVDIFLLQLNMREFDVAKVEHFYCQILFSRVMRKGKWAVDREEYPSEQYPLFCSGRLWVVPTRLVPRILQAAQKERFLWVDDVYLTGILAKKANITLLGDRDGFGSQTVNMEDVGKLLAWHSITDRIHWWNKFVQLYNKTTDITWQIKQ